MPYFSIVMPVLNRAKLLPDALRSILAQTFDDLEILVVDGGSTDGTQEVARSFGEKVRLIDQPGDRPGIGAARSVAFEQTNGRYVACFDSDDHMMPWALETYRQAIEEHHEPAFLLADGLMYRDEAALTSVERKPAKKRLFDSYLTFLRQPRRGWSLASGSVFRADFARQIAGLSDKIVYAEDSDMFLRLGDRPGFVRIEQPVTFGYHQHDENTSMSFDRFIKGMWQLIGEESAGLYPGGPAGAKARRNELTTLLRSAAKRCVKRRRISDGLKLYASTLWWNAQQGKFKFIAGYPLLAASTALRPAKKKPDRQAEIEMDEDETPTLAS